MQETLGQYLRRKRESHLISLEDISRATGISIPLIRALEEDNFHVIPRSEMSIRYLKKYASRLKLSKRDVLHRYEMQYDPTNQAKRLPQLSLFAAGGSSYKQVKREKSLFRKPSFQVVLWSSLILWALVFFSLYVHITGQKKELKEGEQTVVASVVKKDITREKRIAVPADAPKKAVREQDQAAPGSTTDHPAVKSVPPSPPQEKTREVAGHLPNVAKYSHAKVKVIGNSDSKRYHLPGMKYYNRVKAYHLVTFNSEAEAIKAGYTKARE
ncbi:MAG TPA: helix-turn-helix domain-containing protein [Syntrophales bacterium]|nr:helix-turn-helix domain-containing protein [Syntrophales bacterium]